MRLDLMMKEHSMMSRPLPSDLTRAVRHAQLSLLTSAYVRWLIKYRPDQARVPAGSREGGQWTDEGGGGDSGSDSGGGSESRTLGAEEPVGSVNLSTDDVVAYPYPDGTYDIEFVSSRTSVTIDYSRALTGISTIDDTTKRLSETLGDTMARVEFIPGWAPSVYGTAVHVDFANQVRAQGIRGISPSDVEQSFFNKGTADYGEPGSVRTDVVLRNEVGDIIAIYDVKTGGAVLSAGRVRELREKIGVGIGVPIIELQVNRGTTIKGQRIPRRNIGRVMAYLWNPVHRGSAGRVAGA